MQNLRRSVQTKSSTTGLGQSRNPTALAPPRKVIKALYDYNAHNQEELSFTKGDFFHVVGNEDDEDWYEACNPVTGARGYVPVTYFQVLEKGGRNSNPGAEDNGNDNGAYNDPTSAQNQGYQQQQGASTPQAVSPQQKPKCQPLYGIVLYDFGAERPDELDAKVGDAILVIAQSNDEWYVAKPIGRLGGPGLIPVSFVEIRDMLTGKPINVPEMLRQTGTAIPRVEEWKKQAMEYKANSIPLGRIDAAEAIQQQQQLQQQQPSPQQPQQQSIHQSAGAGMHPQQYLQQQPPSQSNNSPTIQQLKNKMSRDLKSQQQNLRRLPSQDFDVNRRTANRDDLQAGRQPTRSNGDSYENGASFKSESLELVNASVDSYISEDDQYWFTVRVDYSNGMTRNLSRLYEDFYSFHIALLEEFPVESGRVGDQPRILPFMPIPLQVVTDTITASRRADLDGYVKELCGLPLRITQHPLVYQLFALKEGDTEVPTSSINNASPSVGRSTPSNSMFHSSASSYNSDRRPSTAGGPVPRSAFAAKLQGGGSFRYGEDAPSSSPSLRSQASFATPPTSNTSEEMIKLKISYQEDIMAMRIPVSVNFRSLQQKIFERINCENKELSYRDDRGDFARIQNDSDVREAIDNSGGKLMIYVD